jgi:hypothetical protein
MRHEIDRKTIIFSSMYVNNLDEELSASIILDNKTYRQAIQILCDQSLESF